MPVSQVGEYIRQRRLACNLSPEELLGSLPRRWHRNVGQLLRLERTGVARPDLTEAVVRRLRLDVRLLRQARESDELAYQQWLDDPVLRRLEVKSEYNSVAAGSVDGRFGDDELLDHVKRTVVRQSELRQRHREAARDWRARLCFSRRRRVCVGDDGSQWDGEPAARWEMYGCNWGGFNSLLMSPYWFVMPQNERAEIRRQYPELEAELTELFPPPTSPT